MPSVITGEVCPKNSIDCHEITLKIHAGSIEQLPEYDYSALAEYWMVAFSSVLMLYLFSLGIGHVLKFIKNA
ncbi:MAG: hypothetical protein RR575_09035 [Acinetobacter sp.]